DGYTNFTESFYERAKPPAALNKRIVLLNATLPAELGLNQPELQKKDGIDILSGNAMPIGATSIAQAYAGHQFGQFTILGDGRAIMIGEQLTPDGERFDIQLKGAGKTIFSRGGDGLAAIGPMLREYLISEALYGLNIPTTRSLAVVEADNAVHREQIMSRGILTRVAKSHLRVGTFEFAYAVGNK